MSYDQWKCRDPNEPYYDHEEEYEDEGPDEPDWENLSFDECMCKARERERAWRREQRRAWWCDLWAALTSWWPRRKPKPEPIDDDMPF